MSDDVVIPPDHVHALEYDPLENAWNCWCGAGPMGDEEMPDWAERIR